MIALFLLAFAALFLFPFSPRAFLNLASDDCVIEAFGWLGRAYSASLVSADIIMVPPVALQESHVSLNSPNNAWCIMVTGKEKPRTGQHPLPVVSSLGRNLRRFLTFQSHAIGNRHGGRGTRGGNRVNGHSCIR